MMTRTFPGAFQRHGVLPVHHYPDELSKSFDRSPPAASDPSLWSSSRPACTTALTLSTAFLHNKWASSLVEGRDLVVNDDMVYMKTINGLKRVDVIYRRIDDDFLDPLTFRGESVLGVPG